MVYTDLKNLSDSDLIYMIRNDSDEDKIEYSKEIIFERYCHMPKYMLNKLRLQYKKSDEEDLIQHGYLLISKSIEKFDYINGCKFKTFLFFVLKKGYLSQYYKKDKYRFNETTLSLITDDNDINTMDLLSKKKSEILSYENIMMKEYLQKIKSSLTESEYNCIISRYHGASYKEISDAFGYSLKQIDNKIQSVRKDKIKYLNME